MQSSPSSFSAAPPPGPGPLERQINLAVPAVAIESEIQSRLRQLAKTVRMQGFRPGKVPLSMVAKQYGFQVRQEVVSDSVQQSFSSAIRDNNYRVAGMPRFQAANTGQNADQFEFTATFEVYPDVVLGSLASKALKRPVVTVGDADVDRTIETLRKQRATFSKVERAAQQGDFLVIDFVGTVDGIAFSGGSAENFGLVLGEGRMLPDFEAGLPGLRADESKTLTLTFPADYQAELAGKAAQFQVTVKSVNEAILPAVDAEFAKNLGVADGDLAKMRGEIRHNLEREAKKRIKIKVRDQVMDALLQVASLDLPRALVDNELERLRAGAKQELEGRGMTTENMELPADLFRERAERRVKLGLVLAELVKREGLLPKPEQTRAAIEELADSYEEPQQMVRWYYTQPERMQEIESQVAEENAVEWAASQMAAVEEQEAFETLMGIQRT